MLSLPDDLLEVCITRFPPQTIIACSSTCKRINRIITASIPIQLILHQYLYQDILTTQDPLVKTQTPSAKDRLTNLIRRQKAFEKFQPSISTYDLGEDREILSVYGSYIATSADYTVITNPEIDDEGRYSLFTLLNLSTSSSGEATAVEEKVYKVSFKPDEEILAVESSIDLSKNLVIVAESIEEDYLHVKIHIFKAFNPGDTLEYQGVGIMDLGRCFGQDGAGYGHQIALGPEDRIVISRGHNVQVYSWKTGAHLYSLKRLGLISFPYSLNSVGSDLIAVSGSIVAPPNPDDAEQDTSRPFDLLQYLLIYQINGLSTTLPKDPTPPAVVLSFPTSLSDLPPQIREKIPPPKKYEHLYSPGGHVQTGSSESEILHLTMWVETEFNRTDHRYEKRHGISMIFPPGKLKELVKDVLEGRVSTMAREGKEWRWAVDSLQIPSEKPMVEPKHWWKYTFWAFEDILSASNDSRSFGSKVISIEEREDDQDDEDEDDGWVHGDVTISVLDFNHRLFKSHPPLGQGLGGTSNESLLVEVGETSKVSVSSILSTSF
ncbi:hypothetical protein I302_107314 [Kwoniella bestiolae CBS 10118]|uniref:F-box domain-containing protein n=1 Tax=Kwoniella bestiolae CBS 10118 TaxID=1296100 RepID=A0AAJ8KCC1_9TREE